MSIRCQPDLAWQTRGVMVWLSSTWVRTFLQCSNSLLNTFEYLAYKSSKFLFDFSVLTAARIVELNWTHSALVNAWDPTFPKNWLSCPRRYAISKFFCHSCIQLQPLSPALGEQYAPRSFVKSRMASELRVTDAIPALSFYYGDKGPNIQLHMSGFAIDFKTDVVWRGLLLHYINTINAHRV